MTSRRMAVLTCGAMLLSSIAVERALAVDEARLHKLFNLMDADGDGQISRPELQAGKGAVFIAIDQDGSMTLTQDEMHLSPEGFKLLAGADGVVDGQEFIAADITSFDAIDRNHDRQIDFAELRDYIAKYSN